MIATYNQKSLKENGYEVVKSVDIFNELITRFSNDFNGQYLNKEDVSKNNNLEAGWQKFLSIEDLCSVALVARKNLPNVEFVYNDINLEDKSKLPILKSIIDRIQSFEEKNKDSINDKDSINEDVSVTVSAPNTLQKISIVLIMIGVILVSISIVIVIKIKK